MSLRKLRYREGAFTLDKRGPGQLIGWASLMRGESTEFVHASTGNSTCTAGGALY